MSTQLEDVVVNPDLSDLQQAAPGARQSLLGRRLGRRLRCGVCRAGLLAADAEREGASSRLASA
jgi:hypothetical protein